MAKVLITCVDRDVAESRGEGSKSKCGHAKQMNEEAISLPSLHDHVFWMT